MVIPSK